MQYLQDQMLLTKRDNSFWLTSNTLIFCSKGWNTGSCRYWNFLHSEGGGNKQHILILVNRSTQVHCENRLIFHPNFSTFFIQGPHILAGDGHLQLNQ